MSCLISAICTFYNTIYITLPSIHVLSFISFNYVGKTLQTISFIAYTLHVKKLPGLHLVVVPLSVLFNWMNEFKKWCPSIKVLRLHCSNDKKEQSRLRTIMNDKSLTQVVVTTYDMLKSEGWKTWLRLVVWRSVFLDEGHRIKNDESAVAMACGRLRSRFKVSGSIDWIDGGLGEWMYRYMDGC